MSQLSTEEISQLRRKNYNAEILHVIEAHSDLRILQVRCFDGAPHFKAGQYVTLGLGNWEKRVAGVDPENLDDLHLHRISKRAYSIACSIFVDGELKPASNCSYLEFYIALVRSSPSRPPALTPRIFSLQTDDQLFVSTTAHGNYTLDSVGDEADVLFMATGVGEAPHNTMAAELLARGGKRRIINITCARYQRDLAYLSVHRELEKHYPNYQYLALTTREAINTDPSEPGYVGKQYLQDYLKSGQLEKDAKIRLDSQRAHVFLCGSPDMIGAPPKHHDPLLPAAPSGGMVDLLLQRGFQIDKSDQPGNLHFERYW